MPIRVALLGLAVVLAGCTGQRLADGVAGFAVGAAVGSVSAAVLGEEAVPAFFDKGFEGAVEAANAEDEETDLKVILTQDDW